MLYFDGSKNKYFSWMSSVKKSDLTPNLSVSTAVVLVLSKLTFLHDDWCGLWLARGWTQQNCHLALPRPLACLINIAEVGGVTSCQSALRFHFSLLRIKWVVEFMPLNKSLLTLIFGYVYWWHATRLMPAFTLLLILVFVFEECSRMLLVFWN